MKTKQIGLRISQELIKKYQKRANELGINYMDLIKVTLAKYKGRI